MNHTNEKGLNLSVKSFLTAIGVDEETAREDACKIEHDISEESFNALRLHLLKLQ